MRALLIQSKIKHPEKGKYHQTGGMTDRRRTEIGNGFGPLSMKVKHSYENERWQRTWQK